MSEVIAVSTPSPRTYPAPVGVVDEVMQGVRWARAYSIDVPDSYQQAASLLASSPSLEADQIDDLALLFDSVVHASPNGGWVPGSGDYPCKDRILASLAGGQPLKEWSENVLASLERSSAAEHDALLASVGYDPRNYVYRGLCTTGDPDVVTHLARVSDGSWQCWDPSETHWRELDATLASSCLQVDPDDGVLAAIIDAVSAGDGLALVYGTPLSFLPSGLQTTTLGDDVDSPVVAAVVDDVDTTAVWSLVHLYPGRELAVRAAGVWEDSDHWPTGADVVYLTDEGLRDRVVADVDTAETVVPARSNSFITAEELRNGDLDPDDVLAVSPDGKVQSLSQMFADIAAGVGAYDEDDDDDEEDDDRRDRNRAVLADIETLREWAVLRARRDSLLAAVENRSKDLMPIVAQLGGPDRNRGGAERLRRYWTRGEGALKIRWGTHGDWRRCYRQLYKYMGPRAAGYCFTGDTEFTTRDGVMTFAEAVDTDQLVLTAPAPITGKSNPVRKDGRWVQASIRSYGEQRVLRVTLTRNRIKKVVKATPEHVWFASKDGRSAERFRAHEIRTEDLEPGMSLASLLPKEQVSRSTPSPFGIAAGFVFGDGYREGDLGSRVDLWGEKNEDLLTFFDSCKASPIQIKESGVLGSRVSGMPGSWKALPALDEGISYLYGWLAGYIAADGSVNKIGHVTLYSSRRENLEHVAAIAARLGIGTFGVTEFWRKGYGRQETPIYRMSFVQQTVPSALLLRKKHRERFDAVETKQTSVRWRVESVEDHGEVEEVFCAEVPEFETFSLRDGIWVHNCQLRHKEVTGMYTGNKAHRSGVDTVKASGAPASALLAANDGTSGMVALVPRETDAKRLAVPEGDPVEDIHLTLCFLGKTSDWSQAQLDAVHSAVASMVDDAVVPDLDGPSGIEAHAFGTSLWNPGDEAVWVYSIGGSGELPWIYDIVKQTLAQVEEHTDLPLPEQHVPWIPHVTAAYGLDSTTFGEMTDRLGTVVFDRLRVSFGNDVVDYRLDYLKDDS